MSIIFRKQLKKILPKAMLLQALLSKTLKNNMYAKKLEEQLELESQEVGIVGEDVSFYKPEHIEMGTDEKWELRVRTGRKVQAKG